MVEKTILGNVIEETASNEADPELDKPAEEEAGALADELPIELLELLVESWEVLDVALVI